MTRYNAEISAGSLLPLESRRIATLLLSDPDPAAWLHAIATENILQKKTPATARRQATLLRRRLTALDAQAWEMIAERENDVVIQLLLAAAVKHSQVPGIRTGSSPQNQGAAQENWWHGVLRCAFQLH
jgi:hypothetical protein